MEKNRIYETFKYNLSSYALDHEYKVETNILARLFLPKELFFKVIDDDTIMEIGSKIKFNRFHSKFINREYILSLNDSNYLELEDTDERYKSNDYKNATKEFFRRLNQIVFYYDVVRDNSFKKNNDFENVKVNTYTDLSNQDYLYGIKSNDIKLNVGLDDSSDEFDNIKSGLFENIIYVKLNDKEYREIYSGKLYMSCYDINNKEILYNYESGTYFYPENLKEYYKTNAIITNYGNEEDLSKTTNDFYSKVIDIKERDERAINQIQLLRLINKE